MHLIGFITIVWVAQQIMTHLLVRAVACSQFLWQTACHESGMWLPVVPRFEFS